MFIQQLKNKKCLLGLLSFLLFNFYTLANNQKFGKVSLAEVLQKECSYYPDADAEYLLSNGRLNIFHGDSDYYVHKRIKVYTEEGKKHATVKIRYYEPLRENGESIQNLKAICYNIENGELVKTKLQSDDKFDKRINDYYKERTLLYPMFKLVLFLNTVIYEIQSI